jgi:hypothetical protein
VKREKKRLSLLLLLLFGNIHKRELKSAFALLPQPSAAFGEARVRAKTILSLTHTRYTREEKKEQKRATAQ